MLLPKLGWQIFIQGGLPLAFGSKAKQWSIGIYMYLTPLRQHCKVTALLTDQLLKIIYGW